MVNWRENRGGKCFEWALLEAVLLAESSFLSLIVGSTPSVFTIKTVFLYQKDVFLQEIIQK